MTIAELYAAIDGNYESAKRILSMDRLIEKFIVRLLDDKSFDRLKQAAESNNPTELFESTHALKGICANLGLDNLSKAASVISEEFRPGKPRTMTDEAVQAHIAEFSNKFSSTLVAIRQFAGK